MLIFYIYGKKIPQIPDSDDVIKVYEIPGHNPISEKDLLRYKKDKEQDDAIQEIAILFNINKVPADQQPFIIEKALNSNNPEIQLEGAKMIFWALENEREDLKQLLMDKGLIKIY